LALFVAYYTALPQTYPLSLHDALPIFGSGMNELLVQYLTGAVDRIYEIISASGVQIIIFLAGLQGISPQLYEAAQIEGATGYERSEEHTSELQSRFDVVCRLLLDKKKY